MPIESGSHTPGVRAANFGLPPGTALRIECPAEALRPLLLSYRVFDSDVAVWSGATNWVLPNAAMLWIALAPDPINVAIGRRSYDMHGSAVLFGATSRATIVTSRGGIRVVVDIGPMAWARLFVPSAEALRDRVAPLDQLLPPGWTENLVACIAGCDRGSEVKSVLDAFFMERLPPPHPLEALLARIAALVVDEATHDLSDAAALTGIGGRDLLRLTKRYFGFPPKALMMRTRFMRAMAIMLVDDGDFDFAVVPAGYYDASHFLRDAERFLGMTPRRFMSVAQPYLRATMRARVQILGAALPMLDRTPTFDQKAAIRLEAL